MESPMSVVGLHLFRMSVRQVGLSAVLSCPTDVRFDAGRPRPTASSLFCSGTTARPLGRAVGVIVSGELKWRGALACRSANLLRSALGHRPGCPPPEMVGAILAARYAV